MFTHDDILTPLALTVIIDNKVKDPEMRAFSNQATALLGLFELAPMSGDELQEWFENNETALREKIKGKGKNTTILHALTRFKEDIHVENMYDAMVAISISDKEYRLEESDLIKSAASLWGYQRPPFKVKR